MRAVVQRVSRGAVRVGGEVVAAVQKGFVVLLGVEEADGAADVAYMVDKVSGLRVFEDQQGKMNLSLGEVHGQILVVSQFTLFGDCRKGRRPSFLSSAAPPLAEERYEQVVHGLRERGHVVATGRFRADMEVELVNDGPVTLLLDSRKTF